MAYMHPDKHSALTKWTKHNKTRSRVKKRKSKSKSRKMNKQQAINYVQQHIYEISERGGRG